MEFILLVIANMVALWLFRLSDEWNLIIKRKEDKDREANAESILSELNKEFKKRFNN